MPSRTRQAGLTAALTLLGAFLLLFPGAGIEPEPMQYLVHFPLDDGWIHQVYARSLATSGMPAYNPGELEAGFTSPLWMLLLTPLHWFTGGSVEALVLASKALSLVFLWLSALAAARLLVHWTQSSAWGLTAGAVVALTPSLLFAGLSAMEVTLCAWLLLELCLAVIQERPRRLGLTAAAVVVARPESIVFLVVLAFACLARRDQPWPRRLGTVTAAALPAMATFGLWVAYCLAVTGYPLPNTYYVKSVEPRIGVGLSYLWRDVLLEEYGVRTALAPLLIACAAVWGRRLRGALLLLAGSLTTWLALSANHLLTPGVGFYMQRYFYPFWPMLLVLGTLGAALGWRRTVTARATLRGAAAILAGIVLLVGWGADLWARRGLYASNCDVVRRLHVEPALDVAANAPVDWPVAAEAAGAMRFFSGHTTIDLLGLNRTDIAHLPDDPIARRCYFAALDPPLFVVPDFWTPALRPVFEFHLLARARVDRYTLVRSAEPHTVVTLAARRREGALRGCPGGR